jgi:hypothetical protein
MAPAAKHQLCKHGVLISSPSPTKNTTGTTTTKTQVQLFIKILKQLLNLEVINKIRTGMSRPTFLK